MSIEFSKISLKNSPKIHSEILLLFFKKVLTIFLNSSRIAFVRRSGGMADAQASGACSRKAVWVQVPSPALKKEVLIFRISFFYSNFQVSRIICLPCHCRNGAASPESPAAPPCQ